MPQFHRNKAVENRNKLGRRFQVKRLEPRVNLPKSNIALENKTEVHQSSLPDMKTEPQEKVEETQSQLQDINRMIEKATHDLHNLEADKQTQQAETLSPGVVDQPSQFNGVNNHDERIQLVEAELTNEQRKTAKLLNEIAIIKQDFDQEKQRLEQHIRDLKRELHRSQPLEEHSFFTISKQLKEAVTVMDKLVTTNGSVLPIKADLPPIETPAAPKKEEPIPTTQLPAKEVAKEVEPKKVENKEEKSPTPPKKKKLLITGAVAIMILVIGSTIASLQLAKPKVNDNLVKEYLSKNGQVAGATDTSNAGTPTTQPASTSGSDNSQLDIPLAQTMWTDFKEPMFGINLQYPQNVVKVNRSESNITFIRKDGYIFRIQKIETGLDLAEYWKQIKATNMNYSDTTTKFKGHEAIALTLEEMTKYPGDRYLVKIGNAIFDIWYATPSNTFNADDISRAKRMLDSLTFVETP
jgi:hypothetical protein